MDIETLHEYCKSKEGVTEGFPFGDDTLVFKVKGKMFALANLEGELRINLKCDEEYAMELRERYNCVLPGYHMNKRLWNTIVPDASVPEKTVKRWIDHSYNLVAGIREKEPGIAE